MRALACQRRHARSGGDRGDSFRKNSDEYMSYGVPEEELIREARRAFISNGAPDPDDASRRAREAVRLWAGRAWIITTVMTDEDGRSRYGFVHQSFLEYFAAVYGVRRVDTPAELYANLRGRLFELNGWTVTQIAVSVIEAWKDHGGQRFLAVLLEDAVNVCDMDSFALLRLGISLVAIVPVPAEQLVTLAELGMRFVGRSIVLPDGDRAVFEAHEENLQRSRGYAAFDPDGEDATAAATDPGSPRESVVMPTSRSMLIADDIADLASDAGRAYVERRLPGEFRDDRQTRCHRLEQRTRLRRVTGRISTGRRSGDRGGRARLGVCGRRRPGRCCRTTPVGDQVRSFRRVANRWVGADVVQRCAGDPQADPRKAHDAPLSFIARLATGYRPRTRIACRAARIAPVTLAMRSSVGMARSR